MTPYVLCTTVILLMFCTAPSSRAEDSPQAAPRSVTPVQKYLLYAPQAVASKQVSSLQQGIIVQEIDVKKGDTLYDISRKFSGHGMYYPQILLFNEIHNPRLIYPGSRLKVPIAPHAVTDEGAGAKATDKSDRVKAAGDKKARPEIKSDSSARQPHATASVPLQNGEISLSDLRSGGTGNSTRSTGKKKSSLPARKKAVPEPPVVTTLSAPVPASYIRKASTVPVADTTSGQKLFEAAVKAYRVDDCHTALELLDRYLATHSDSPLAADANLYKAECYLKLSAQ